MVKLRTYIGKLKKDIVDDYKKKLDQQLKNDLLPLVEEKKSLESLLKDKKKSLLLQKKLIAATYKKSQSDAAKEASKSSFIYKIWTESLDRLFEEHAILWYESQINAIPKDKGVLRYSAKTPDQILKKIKKLNQKIKLIKDNDISEGFIYESDRFILEITKDVFSQEQYPSFKRKLHKELENISI